MWQLLLGSEKLLEVLNEYKEFIDFNKIHKKSWGKGV